MDINLETINFDIPIALMNKGVQSQTSRALFRASAFMQAQAKQNLSNALSGAKKRTGNSAQSIVISGDDNEKKVTGGVKYLKYIEEGTGIYVGRKPWITNFGGTLPHPVRIKGMKPRPFWYKSVDETNKEIPNIFEQEFKDII